MSTVGTLYDETVKNGFAKLLSAQVLTNASYVDFIAPLAYNLGYRTYWFDFDHLQITSGGNDRLVSYVSWDGGVNWCPDHLWSIIRCYSHNASDTYGSVALNPSGSPTAPYRDVLWIGLDQVAVGYQSGRLYFHRGAAGAGGYRPLYGEMTGLQSGQIALLQHAQYTWHAQNQFNAIRFRYTVGLMTGVIRCYGLKTGDN